jgi:hypothetical protein
MSEEEENQKVAIRNDLEEAYYIWCEGWKNLWQDCMGYKSEFTSRKGQWNK